LLLLGAIRLDSTLMLVLELGPWSS